MTETPNIVNIANINLIGRLLVSQTADFTNQIWGHVHSILGFNFIAIFDYKVQVIPLFQRSNIKFYCSLVWLWRALPFIINYIQVLAENVIKILGLWDDPGQPLPTTVSPRTSESWWSILVCLGLPCIQTFSLDTNSGMFLSVTSVCRTASLGII